METNPNSLDGIFEVLDYHDLWYKWMTLICPNAKEQTEFKNMNKQEKYNYLKEKVNGR